MKKDEKEKSKTDIDWENRTLCSDLSCIGVIGPDGHCKECGKPFEGSSEEELSFQEEETEDFNNAEIEQPMQEQDIEPAEDIDWENRTLCSDLSCIGVIGPDGRCKECGKPFEG